MKFNVSLVGTESRGNNNVGTALYNFFKGYVYNQDGETIDLIPMTKAVGKKTRKRSKYTTITKQCFEAMKGISNWVEGTHTEEGETKRGEEMHFFINEEGERQPHPQSRYYGLEIDGKILSETCELCIFRHYYAGFQKGVYPRKDSNGKIVGYGMKNELITNNGVRAIYAIVNGALVIEPIFFDDFIAFTDKIDATTKEPVKDTTFDYAVEFYNKKNPYNAVFKFDNSCFVDLEVMQELANDNGIECTNLDRTLDNQSFLDTYDFNEFEAPADDESDDIVVVSNNLTMEDMEHLTTKTKVKKYAKDELKLTLTFAASESVPAMKQKVINAVNA